MTNNTLNKDFKSFMSEENIKPSKKISNSVYLFVKKNLHPNIKIVFAKLFTIQAFIGIVTLSFCPQFSFSLTNNNQIFHFLHNIFGLYACVSICAALFMGLGAAVSAQLLTIEEIKIIRSSKLLYYLIISSLTVLSFFIIGAEVYLEIISFWIIGALFGGVFMLELSALLRRKLLY
ncbi:MAG: hypothetical protein HAW60_02570 [Bdellovibrionales bacterium]|nr:hypothetical protein [Bdellovibrionales bacterium]